MERIAKCAVCGKEFVSLRSNHKCCSQKCGREHQRRVNKKEVKPRTCVICGTEYYSTSANKLTCSKECGKKLDSKRSCQYQKNKRERERVEKPKKVTPKPRPKKRKICKTEYGPRVCIKCGVEYIPKRSSQKYCSTLCRCPHLAKEIYKEPEPLKGLALDNHIAREQGLTYGQWRGLEYLRQLKEG